MARAQILVADGNPGFAAELAANLKSLGYAVTGVVSSPEEALKNAEEKRPDLVLLDLKMLAGGKKGEAARQIRQRSPNLVYLVGEEDRQNLRRAKITHSFDYLRKAYDTRELETIIDMALYRRRLEREIIRGQETPGKPARMQATPSPLQNEIHRLQDLEEALQAERHKLYHLLDTLPAYIVLLAPDYSMPFVNREFIKRFGAPEGRKCYDFLFGRTSPCQACETYKVLQTDAPHEWEWTGPDGRNYQIYDFPFQDSDGSPLILEMGVDVTVLKEKEAQIQKMAAALRRSYEELEARVQDRTQELAQANAALQAGIAERLWSEKKLQETKHDLHRAQAVAHTGSWRLDVRKNELLWSDETHRIFGIPQGTALTYETFLAAVHPEDREDVDREWTAAMNGAPYDLEHRIVVGDAVKWVRERAELEFDHQGQLLGGFGTAQDITERKEAETTLQASKDFLEIANRHTEMAPLLRDYVAAVKEHTGCEAVAIRILDEQGRIPYEAYEGFPPEFIACESPLSLDSDRCLCINVCKGAVAPDLPFYTPGSSCHINRFSHLLATVSPELLGETRNVCHQFGYESVALIPIVFGGQILGLIHLADHRENMVPLSLTTRLEGIGLQLGTAINRVRAEEAWRRALAESRRRQAEISALLQATRAVLEAGDFEGIARSIFDSCKDLIGASSGYIALLTADGQENEVLFLDTGGLICLVDSSLPMPVRGLRAEAYRTGRTVYHNDFSGSDYAQFLPPGHVGLENVLFAPLVVKGKAVGLLGLGNKPGGYTANDARLAAGFGELAALALVNNQAEEERERLIQELETERARLQAIIASAPEAIVVADASGRLVLANPAAERLYAKHLEDDADLEGCASFPLCHGDGSVYVPDHQPLLRSATAGETHRNLEMVLTWPDGQRRDLLVNTAPIKDHLGRSSGAVGLFQDITQRKRVEEQIRKLNAELSDRIREVSDRTLQLEAANKELEAFSYSVSHDLRSPLRAIEGFVRILLEAHGAEFSGEGLRLLQVIRSNTQLMGELIDDLLALSRLGRQEIKARKIDLGGLVTSVFRELRAQAPERQMQLILNPAPPIYGDRSLINQVLVNLLGNAVKFTKSREKAIIEVGGWTEGKEDIYFVKDNGVGFDMRYVDKIFGVFQRLHRREDFDGTGVGLAIVQRIITRHGGRVWATGQVDGGATFYFALPRKGEESVK